MLFNIIFGPVRCDDRLKIAISFQDQSFFQPNRHFVRRLTARAGPQLKRIPSHRPTSNYAAYKCIQENVPPKFIPKQAKQLRRQIKYLRKFYRFVLIKLKAGRAVRFLYLITSNIKRTEQNKLFPRTQLVLTKLVLGVFPSVPMKENRGERRSISRREMRKSSLIKNVISIRYQYGREKESEPNAAMRDRDAKCILRKQGS